MFGRKRSQAGSRALHLVSHGENRVSYRRAEGPNHGLSISVRLGSGTTYEGQLLDLSIGGAGARFALDDDPELVPDQLVGLVIENADRSSRVETPARVVYGQPGGEAHWRYGFQFVAAGDLFEQLDEFYAACFNRRGSDRVEVPASHRVAVELRLPDGAIVAGELSDLSATGLGVLVSEEAASALATEGSAQVDFLLPGDAKRISTPVELANCKPIDGVAMVGLRIVDATDVAERFERYVRARSDEIDRWESQIGVA